MALDSLTRIAITGHTSGIGKALFDYFKDQGCDVVGFSRSNGYTFPEDEAKALKEIIECDVFINNGLPVKTQCNLLSGVFKVWQFQKKTIVNMGSYTTAHDRQKPHPRFSDDYNNDKKELDKICKELRTQPKKCKIILLRPSYVKTEKMPDDGTTKYISLVGLCGLVDWVIGSSIHFEDVLFKQSEW